MRHGLIWLLFVLVTALGSWVRAAAPVPTLQALDGLKDLQGRPVTPAAYQGKVVLVDVWATWCAPCRRSLPFYQALQARLREQGFTVLAVSVDKDDEAVRRMVARDGLQLTVLRDPSGKAPQALGVAEMPTCYLFDRTGKLRLSHAGFTADAPAQLERAVREALQ